MPRVLVANRGEIAIRILRTASELEWQTVAIYTVNDSSHAAFADEAVRLESVADYTTVETIIKVALSTNCTHVHPGYGFLSENPALPLSLARTGGPISITFIGPSPETLRISSDKILSRELATSLNVKVASGTRVSSSTDVHHFAQRIGYPVMIKALDGGGGRGIRIVRAGDEVEEAFKRCLGESPSKQVFAEQGLTGSGWKHVEVQIIGDGTGAVNHMWERECSIQRRFQKIVEIAPSRFPRSVIRPLLEASLRIASHLKYKGLGTFEFLINTLSHDWVFLEINPRVQVEHTVTEEILDIDLLRYQMLTFIPGATLASLSLNNPLPLPTTNYAVQLRLTAEDPSRDFQLSPGIIRPANLSWPTGRGVRIDTWLTVGPNLWPLATAWTVGTDFDSLLAKIIVRGRTFEEMTQKSRQALKELHVSGTGVKTNIVVLAGVINHPDWTSGAIDTLWLERNIGNIMNLGKKVVSLPKLNVKSTTPDETTKTDVVLGSRNNIILQSGTLFHFTLSPAAAADSSTNSDSTTIKHTLTLTSIGQNAFPDKLTGILQSSFSSSPLEFSLSQSSSAAIISSSSFEFADPNNSSHVASPLTGKIVDLHPALLAVSMSGRDGKGNYEQRGVKKGDTLVVLSVMKMENVVLAPFSGFVERIGKGIKLGVILGEDMLVCIINNGNLYPNKL